MKKSLRKGIIILIILLVFTSIGLSRVDIGKWQLNISGIWDNYFMEIYFDDGMTYCYLHNLLSETSYSGQIDIFTPSVKQDGSYGFNINFENGKIILKGFEQKSEFDGLLVMNGRTYSMTAVGTVVTPNLEDYGYYGSVEDVLEFAYEGHKNLKIVVNAYYNGLKCSGVNNYLKVFINGVAVTDWFFESSRTITAAKGDIIKALIRYSDSNGSNSELYCTIPSYRGSESYVLQDSGTFNFLFDATLELQK